MPEKETQKRKNGEGTLVSLVRGKGRDCKEESPVSYPLLPHLGFVPSSRLGTEAEWKVAPVLGIHGLMGEAREGCRGSGAAMRLTAFSVGARRASCGRCRATKHGEARMGIGQRWREGHLSRAEGVETMPVVHTEGEGGLKSSPEFVKPWHLKQGCLSAFLYFSSRARDKKWTSKHRWV